MMDRQVTEPKRTSLRRWHTDSRGKHHLGGRWSKARISEVLIESRHKWFSLDDLARIVYGTTGEKCRANVRKHIMAQRNYMLAKDMPIVTKYGPRGVIQCIKLYEQDQDSDKVSLSMELDRLLHRGEITRDRYQKLAEILRLPPPAPAE